MLLADVVAVVAFVLIGRASHDEGEAVIGFLRTLWPFLAGLAVGWVVLLRRDRSNAGLADRSAGDPVGRRSDRVAAGVVTGVYAAVVGLALRALTGQGVAASFLVVAVIVLTVFMTGWRTVLLLVRRVSGPVKAH